VAAHKHAQWLVYLLLIFPVIGFPLLVAWLLYRGKARGTHLRRPAARTWRTRLIARGVGTGRLAGFNTRTDEELETGDSAKYYAVYGFLYGCYR
jgi:hypothetical protein